MRIAAILVCCLAFLVFSVHPRNPRNPRIQVLAWSERTEPADAYPNGINGAVAEMLKNEKDVKVTVANLSDAEQGLSEDTLKQTDVVVWFGHRKHREVTDASVERVVRHVTERGMGYLPLHSAHYARPYQELMRIRAEAVRYDFGGKPPGAWLGGVKNTGQPQTIRVLEPKHPIAKGVKDFVIPKDEVYNNPFNVPAPDLKVLEGVWEGGEQHGSDGLIWNIGKGRIFYFRAGHETYPIYYQTEVQQVLKNAVRWLARQS